MKELNFSPKEKMVINYKDVDGEMKKVEFDQPDFGTIEELSEYLEKAQSDDNESKVQKIRKKICSIFKFEESFVSHWTIDNFREFIDFISPKKKG